MKRIFLVFGALTTTLFGAAPQPGSLPTPLIFEPNRGQASDEIQWIARGSGFQLALTSSGAAIMLQSGASPAQPDSAPPRPSRRGRPGAASRQTSRVDMKLFGAHPWQAVGVSPTGGISNYLLGEDENQWLTDIPHYAQVRVQDRRWPGR